MPVPLLLVLRYPYSHFWMWTSVCCTTQFTLAVPTLPECSLCLNSLLWQASMCSRLRPISINVEATWRPQEHALKCRADVCANLIHLIWEWCQIIREVEFRLRKELNPLTIFRIKILYNGGRLAHRKYYWCNRNCCTQTIYHWISLI